MQLKLFKDEIQNDLIDVAKQWLDSLEFMDSLPSPLECEAIIAWEYMISANKNKFCKASTGICLN